METHDFLNIARHGSCTAKPHMHIHTYYINDSMNAIEDRRDNESPLSTDMPSEACLEPPGAQSFVRSIDSFLLSRSAPLVLPRYCVCVCEWVGAC